MTENNQTTNTQTQSSTPAAAPNTPTAPADMKPSADTVERTISDEQAAENLYGQDGEKKPEGEPAPAEGDKKPEEQPHADEKKPTRVKTHPKTARKTETKPTTKTVKKNPALPKSTKPSRFPKNYRQTKPT